MATQTSTGGLSFTKRGRPANTLCSKRMIYYGRTEDSVRPKYRVEQSVIEGLPIVWRACYASDHGMGTNTTIWSKISDHRTRSAAEKACHAHFKARIGNLKRMARLGQ